MTHCRPRLRALLFAIAALTGIATPLHARPFLVIGNDEKAVWDDDGKLALSPAGRDTVVVLDLAQPEAPKVIATLPLSNSVVGPPTNIGITPNGELALVAVSVDVVKEGDALKQVLENKLHVIDLSATPPVLLTTLTVGRQPSGLDINAAGDMALIANREDKSVSVLSIAGKEVTLVDTVPMGDVVSAVAFTPDGKRALVTKFPAGKVSVLEIAGGKVTYGKLDLPTGPWPYNVAITPDGRLGLTADNGASGASDGSVDTVSVVDMTANPPRIIDRVVVGDGPEGLAISPRGDYAAAVILRGGNSAKKAYFYHDTGSISLLKLDGGSVKLVKQIEVGGLPEPAAFSPDGNYLYVGNYLSKDISILKFANGDWADIGKRFKLDGHPASAKMTAR